MDSRGLDTLQMVTTECHIEGERKGQMCITSQAKTSLLLSSEYFVKIVFLRTTFTEILRMGDK